MGAQGTAILDFGAFPGASDTSLTITGQATIAADSEVEAWVLPATTSDHSVDEHLVEELEVIAHTPVAGTGFTIFGRCTGRGDVRLYGKFTVGWVWN